MGDSLRDRSRRRARRSGLASVLAIATLAMVVMVTTLITYRTKSDILATRHEQRLVHLGQLIIAGEATGRANLGAADAAWGEQPLPADLVAMDATLTVTTADAADNGATITVTATVYDLQRTDTFTYAPADRGWSLVRVTTSGPSRVSVQRHEL